MRLVSAPNSNGWNIPLTTVFRENWRTIGRTEDGASDEVTRKNATTKVFITVIYSKLENK
jgi:hypothetical protein